MYELKVTATKVLGKCTADPSVKPGDYFTVRDGDIRVPDGGFICLWALQNMLPVITPKERESGEEKDADWMWRVHHVQCPDPKGRVIYKIERAGKIPAGEQSEASGSRAKSAPYETTDQRNSSDNGLRSLRVVVEEVKGKCTSGMQPGTHFDLHSGRLYIPPDGHFCLYALQAAMPQLPPRQRPLPDGDWMQQDCEVICPDPAGNVIMRIEEYPEEDD
jgi:uncharacterized repeat protein (TIGR04076 family)